MPKCRGFGRRYGSGGWDGRHERAHRRLLLNILAAVAKFERELIVNRTQEGLARARAQGKRLGRPTGAKDKRKRRTAGYHHRWES